jgi:XTP/dITP diphosphohydrolase
MSRIIVITTSPRLPGLLSPAGWQAAGSGPLYAVDETAKALGLDAIRLQDDVVERLQAAAEQHGTVVCFGDGELAAQLRRGPAEVQLVVGSADPPGARLLDMVGVMDRLRRECPWDSKQTHESLKGYLLEEAYEAYDALQDGDSAALREELGDVLFQVFFHGRLAEESDTPWSIDDVAAELAEKLIRRHPHVFDGLAVSGADEVNANWDKIKRAEKQRESIFDGVPESLPALVLAETLRRKAIRAGLPEDLLPAGSDAGERLFGAAHDDAEAELRATARQFRTRVVAAETAARADGVDPSTMDAETWRRYWTVSPRSRTIRTRDTG